jgi:murein DD-endopeptidase MepM/ murein hydrolase activator NlpD
MATKFSTIYKQELKGKGILSSMGSAVLKSARERTDIRNMIFGGKGMFSATGQKTFGRGYSALSSGAPSATQVSMQNNATNELLSSSERQEALLRVVAKNTFNMNLMARDMNITRQNISTLTRLAAGKASQSQDALWYDVKTRNQSIDSLGKKTPTKATGNTQSGGSGIFGLLGGLFSGGANFIGAVVSGLLGIVGTVGGGVLSAIGSVFRFIPGGFLIGTVALAAVAYLLKKVSESIDFAGLKNDILKGLGLDPDDKENTLTKQILMKLGFSKENAGKIEGMFSDIGTAVADAVSPAIESFKNIFSPVVKAMLIHSQAAFSLLAHGFSIMGQELKYQADKFFNDNRTEIFAAMALGLMGPAAILSPRRAAIITGLAAAAGELTKTKTIPELEKDLAKQQAVVDAGLKNQGPGVPKTLEDIMERYNRPGGSETNTGLQVFNKQGLTNNQLGIADAETKRLSTLAALEDSRRREQQSSQRQRELMDPNAWRENYRGEVERLKLLSRLEQSEKELEELNRTPPAAATAPQRLSISSPYGPRIHPTTGKKEFHTGADIRMPSNTPLFSVVDGKIVAARKDDINGNYITVRGADGTEYSYSHLNSIDVTEGQQVKRGDLIGKSGSTGRSTGPHLHFGVREKGKHRAPLEQEMKDAFIKSQQVSQLSIDNLDQMRALLSPDAGGGTTVNTTNNNYSSGRGDSQAFAGVIDADAIELFARNA